MFVWNKMAVMKSSFLTMPSEKALCLFPNVPQIKEKQKKCLNLLLNRKDVPGLLPTGFGKSLYLIEMKKC